MLPQSLSAADVALIVYSGNIEKGLFPSRLYSFMACGVPIVTNVTKDSDAGKTLGASGADILALFFLT